LETLPLLDLYKSSLPTSQIFTLKVATAMLAETLQNLKDPMRLINESRTSTITQAAKRKGQEFILK
jgi:hypothetical protein